jgi:hypothetical protein
MFKSSAPRTETQEEITIKKKMDSLVFAMSNNKNKELIEELETLYSDLGAELLNIQT